MSCAVFSEWHSWHRPIRFSRRLSLPSLLMWSTCTAGTTYPLASQMGHRGCSASTCALRRAQAAPLSGRTRFLLMVDALYRRQVLEASDFRLEQPAVFNPALVELGSCLAIASQYAFHIVFGEVGAADQSRFGNGLLPFDEV